MNQAGRIVSPVGPIPAIPADPERSRARQFTRACARLELAYMAKNVAPALDEIDITPSNYRFPAPTLPVTATNNRSVFPAGAKETNDRTHHLA